jgi:alpha-amylase
LTFYGSELTSIFYSFIYDHYFDWGLRDEIRNLAMIRRRNRIHPASVAEADIYVASIDEKIIMKIGPRYHVGNHVPHNSKIVAHGRDYVVWEIKRR